MQATFVAGSEDSLDLAVGLNAGRRILPSEQASEPTDEQLRQLLALVVDLKASANEAFKKGDHDKAFSKYYAAHYVLSIPDASVIQHHPFQPEFTSLAVMLLTNQAQAKLSKWNVAAVSIDISAAARAQVCSDLKHTESDRDMEVIINVCGQALMMDPLSAKAYLRRALAWRTLGYPGMWRVDLENCVDCDTSNEHFRSLMIAAQAVLGKRPGVSGSPKSPYDEWEWWHQDPSPITQAQLKALNMVAQSTPGGIRLQMPPPRSNARPLSQVTLQAMQELSSISASPGDTPLRRPVTDSDSAPAHMAAVGPLHGNSGVVGYTDPARFSRRDHYAAFRWLQRLDASGYELCPASYYYLGRAYLHAEAGAKLSVEQAEMHLLRAVDGTHNHALCAGIHGHPHCKSPYCVHERDGHNCLIDQSAHQFIAQKAVEKLLMIYEGGYSWTRQPDRARILLRRFAYVPNASPHAQFNLGLSYRLGRFTRKSFTKARCLYQKAATYPHPSGQLCPDAMAELAQFTFHGLGGLQRDVAGAKQLVAQALRIGDAYLGSLHEERRSLCDGLLQAIECEEVAAEAGTEITWGDLLGSDSAWDPTQRERCERPECRKREMQHSEFKLCSRCKDIHYCSPSCQKLDWRRHKVSCWAREADPDVCQLIKDVPKHEELRMCNACKMRKPQDTFTQNQWRGKKLKRRCVECQIAQRLPEHIDEEEEFRNSMARLREEQVEDERVHAESEAARRNTEEIQDSECSMCFEEIQQADRFTLACRHWGCKECLRQHLIIQPTCHICRSHIDFANATALIES